MKDQDLIGKVAWALYMEYRNGYLECLRDMQGRIFDDVSDLDAALEREERRTAVRARYIFGVHDA